MSIPDHFRALIISQPRDGGQATAKLATIPRESLPAQGEVLMQVFYSSLNYKDALAVTGQPKIVRSFPMVPGIDLAGIVVESSDSRFKRGDSVIATGWGLGERYWGGMADYASVKADWLLPVAPGLSLLTSMAFGTAGLTAMLSVLALEQSGMTSKSGREVLVTGASGGVGSFAIAFLHRRGYKIAAVSQRKSNHDYLINLGADSVIDLSEFLATFRQPLESERWAGAIDSVGGDVLSALLSGMAYRSGVACCGLARGSEFSATVFPFILRGVRLIGIDSVYCPLEERRRAWEEIGRTRPLQGLEQITTFYSLEEVPELAQALLDGKLRGRSLITIAGVEKALVQ
jgi:acrylyl-CoA reductase (NADPH)